MFVLKELILKLLSYKSDTNTGEGAVEQIRMGEEMCAGQFLIEGWMFGKFQIVSERSEVLCNFTAKIAK